MCSRGNRLPVLVQTTMKYSTLVASCTDILDLPPLPPLSPLPPSPPSPPLSLFTLLRFFALRLSEDIPNSKWFALTSKIHCGESELSKTFKAYYGYYMMITQGGFRKTITRHTAKGCLACSEICNVAKWLVTFSRLRETKPNTANPSPRLYLE
ncbi:hypothetical protein V1478_003227 [Vespula squamosa]|uniref:Uncharacterized protein n=1 Tax=Vespula squamosa TaxID=30214 RepID=A0ABD2BS44_VESSQ